MCYAVAAQLAAPIFDFPFSILHSHATFSLRISSRGYQLVEQTVSKSGTMLCRLEICSKSLVSSFMHTLDYSAKMPRLQVSQHLLDRKTISDRLELLADLTELHSGEEIQANTIRAAAASIRGTQEQYNKEFLTTDLDSLVDLNPEMRVLASEIMVTGDAAALLDLLQITPKPVLAMLPLPGLGPKRLRTVWKEMGICDATTLQHAATENRLVHQKGFGPKTQSRVLQSLSQARANAKHFPIQDLRPIAQRLEVELKNLLGPNAKFTFVGEFRRGLTVCNGLEILVDPDFYREIILHMIKTPDYEILTAGTDRVLAKVRETEIHFNFIFRGADYHLECFRRSGSEEHVVLIPIDPNKIYRSEAEIYEDAGLPLMPAALREGKEEVKLTLSRRLPQLIQQQDIKGLFHAHSTYSDGSDSIETMALRCREMGMAYLGISDHGPLHHGKCLTPESISAQHREIDRLNQKMAPFRIFKGIEAEIQADGSLGMPDQLLATFDFVIASMHPKEILSKSDATIRLVRAIQNPYTTMIGHLTGRMLLAHDGQPVDVEAIIDACAEYQVALELNCHPSRMDIDWQIIRKAVAQGVQIAINPNAHSALALADYEPGVIVARKGMLSKDLAVNAQNLDEVAAWLAQRRGKHCG